LSSKENIKINPVIHILKRIVNKKEFGIFIPLLLVFIVTWIINPNFANVQNLMNIAFQASFVFIVAIAMTYVLILGGLDLSVGSVMGLAGVVSGLFILGLADVLPPGLLIPGGILVGLIVGAIIGAFNGLMISKMKIPTLIVTLSTMYIARGLCEFITRGNPVYPLPTGFNWLGQGKFVIIDGSLGISSGGEIGLNVVTFIGIVLAIVAWIVLTKTTFGRSVFAIGGNRETARLSGLKVVPVTITVYIISGMAASISGMLTAARLGSALSNTGVGIEMNVIASTIIGGTSMFGGSGSILGTAIGALMMTMVTNAMVMLHISAFLQKVVIGAIILLAVAIDQYNRRRSGMSN